MSVFVVTGCASGIGRHLMCALLERGHRVVASDINLAALEEYLRQHRLSGASLVCRSADVRSVEDMEALIATAVSSFGRVDVMLNVAGYLLPGYFLDVTPDCVHRHLDINTKGVIFGTMAAAKQMVKQGHGHIVNIASMAGISPVPGLSLYAASKFAVRGFSLSIANELKRKGVFVTVLCPDAVETPMLDMQLDYESAALTFSNPKPLTVDDIERELFDVILETQPIESILPKSRGRLAKFASLFPESVSILEPIFKKLGRKRQQARKQTTNH